MQNNITEEVKLDIKIKSVSEGNRDIGVVGDQNDIVLRFEKKKDVLLSKAHEIKLSRAEVKILNNILGLYLSRANKI